MLWEIFHWIANLAEVLGVVAGILLLGLGLAILAFSALARITGALAGVDSAVKEEDGDLIDPFEDGEWAEEQSEDPNPERRSLHEH